MEIIDYRLECKTGYWQMLVSDQIEIDGRVIDERDWRACSITDVPLDYLLREWELMVNELSSKEIELYNLKEAYLIAEADIVNEVDFKAIYGKNNEKIRKEHCKKELSDLVEQIKELEFSIAWIKQYIPFLKEVIRSKK